MITGGIDSIRRGLRKQGKRQAKRGALQKKKTCVAFTPGEEGQPESRKRSCSQVGARDAELSCGPRTCEAVKYVDGFGVSCKGAKGVGSCKPTCLCNKIKADFLVCGNAPGSFRPPANNASACTLRDVAHRKLRGTLSAAVDHSEEAESKMSTAPDGPPGMEALRYQRGLLK
jgi:hypothetical protein